MSVTTRDTTTDTERLLAGSLQIVDLRKRLAEAEAASALRDRILRAIVYEPATFADEIECPGGFLVELGQTGDVLTAKELRLLENWANNRAEAAYDRSIS